MRLGPWIVAVVIALAVAIAPCPSSWSTSLLAQDEPAAVPADTEADVDPAPPEADSEPTLRVIVAGPPNARKIESALQEITQLEFLQAPISEVLDYLEDIHEVPIDHDEAVFDDLGIDTAIPVTKELRGISLEAAMNLMLQENGLGLVVRNQVILVTSAEEAEANRQVKLYKVTGSPVEVEELADLIQRTIEPGSWINPEQPRRKMTASVSVVNGNLVVNHNRRVHGEVQGLLEAILFEPKEWERPEHTESTSDRGATEEVDSDVAPEDPEDPFSRGGFVPDAPRDPNPSDDPFGSDPFGSDPFGSDPFEG